MISDSVSISVKNNLWPGLYLVLKIICNNRPDAGKDNCPFFGTVIIIKISNGIQIRGTERSDVPCF
jgi:hypothetical protein